MQSYNHCNECEYVYGCDGVLIVFSPPSSDSIGLHSAAYSTSLSPWGKVRHRDWIIAEWPVLRGERALDDFKTYSSSLGATTNSSSSSSSSSSTGDRRNQEPVALATRYVFAS